MTTIGLQRWHGFIKSQDQAELWDLLHPDVVFESPVVHTPQRGRDVTLKYLASATKVLGGPTFTYVGEWTGDTNAQVEGAAQQVKGKAEKAWGNVKDAARDAKKEVQRDDDKNRTQEQQREDKQAAGGRR